MWHSLFNAVWLSAAYFFSLLAAVCVGYWFADVRYRRLNREWKASGIESALITMFGLILSFTLLSSNNSLKERTNLIHQSSDAVAELYRESQLLPPVARDSVRSYLLRFLALELQEHQPDHLIKETHTQKLAAINRRFWQQLVGTVRTQQLPQADLQLLLPAYNRFNVNVFRLHYSFQERTPSSIIGLLLISSWAIGVLVGFTNGWQPDRHYFVPILFVVISVFTIQSIRDLDDPEQGFIRPNYSNLLDLQRIITEEGELAR
jgi:hypothetical protein